MSTYSNNDWRCYEGGELYHHGILGQKWGVRRYQNENGSLTEAGKKRYTNVESKPSIPQKAIKIPKEVEKDIRNTIEEELKKKDQRFADAKEVAKLDKKITKLMNGRKIDYDAMQKLQNSRDLKMKNLSEAEIKAGKEYVNSQPLLTKYAIVGGGVVGTLGTAAAITGLSVCPPAVVAVGAITTAWGAGLGAVIGSVANSKARNATETIDIADKKFEEDLSERLTKKYANDPRISAAVNQELNRKKASQQQQVQRQVQRQMQNQMQINLQNQINQQMQQQVQLQMQQQIQQQVQDQIQQQVQQQIQQQIQLDIQNQMQMQIQNQINTMNTINMMNHF